MKHNKIVVTVGAHYCYKLHRKLMEIISVDLDITGQLLIKYYAFIQYLRKMVIQFRSISAIYRLQGRV